MRTNHVSRAAIVAAAGSCIALVGSAQSANAAALSLDANRSLVQERLVVPTAADINDPYFRVGASAWTGTAGLIINTNSLDQAGFVLTCSATLVSSRLLLTAAHCLDAGDMNRVRVRFGSASSTSAGGTFTEYEATHFWVHPDWTGSVGADDIAALYLGEDAAAQFERYGVYRDRDELGKIHTKVGYGSTGEGSAGTAPTDLANGVRAKRAGQNVYDATGDQVFTDVSEEVLLFDFDSGLSANDVFGIIGGPVNTGVYRNIHTGALSKGIPAGADPADYKLVEANSSPGDSGGGTFIDGLLAGITSFGITGAIVDGACGPGHIDPDSSAPGVDTGVTPVSSACTNSSFGELSGDTRVSGYLDYIDRLLAASSSSDLFVKVPEPAMIGLFGLGFAGLVGARRRKRA